jgi:virginiamycin B lyase
MWFTAMTSGGVGRITVDGELSDMHSVGGVPSMIVNGPDNALWFTLNQDNAIGRLTPSGDLKVRELPTAAAGPVGIAATHDDAVWFTEVLADKLGRIPMNEAIQEMELPGKPHAVVADQDDGVWVSLWGADQIARVSGDGSEVVTMDLPPGSEPHGLAICADGALWVALESGFVVRMST